MISNKTLATLFLITSSINTVASSSSSGTQGSSPSNKPTLKKRRGRGRSKPMLIDTTNDESPVEIPRSDGEFDTLQEPTSGTKTNPVLEDATNTADDVIPRSSRITTQGSIWQRLSSWIAEPAKEKFKRFIEEGSYRMARCLAIAINDDDLLKLVCSAVKTIDQYKGIVDYLRGRKLVVSFYVYGDIEVVGGAIVAGSKVYAEQCYFENGDLEKALHLALEKDRHDRFIELLDVRKETTAATDGEPKAMGWETSFEWFVDWFLYNLAPWEDGMALRRFFIPRGDDLKNNYRDILDILCRWLVYHLSIKLRLPKAERLLVDLIGQPSLLTPVALARGFLRVDVDKTRTDFIGYGYREALQEGLKTEYNYGGEKLWRVMQAEQPDQFPGQFPVTDEARAAVCVCFPTKQEKEELWTDANARIFYAKIKNHDPISQLLIDVLWLIIFEYVILHPDIDDSIISTE